MLITSDYRMGSNVFVNASEDQVKNEPMFFRADYSFALRHGKKLTRDFLSQLPREWVDSKDLTIDSRVHMLMPGMYPCIPGWHHDDVPRTRNDKQPNYETPEYKAEHVMCLRGTGPATEFAIGISAFLIPVLGQTIYKEWHPVVEGRINNGLLQRVICPFNRLVFFDWLTWHQGTPAKERSFRFFIRASRNTGRIPENQIRCNANVYLPALTEGW